MSKQMIYGVLVDDDEHCPNLGESLSISPQAWRPTCSCGWQGLVIIDYTAVDHLPEILQDFANEHGADATLELGAVFGNREDALVQVLYHLNYDSARDKMYVEKQLDCIVEELKSLVLEPKSAIELNDLIVHMSEATKEIAEQKERCLIWETTKIPIKRANEKEMDLAMKQFIVDLWENR